jgi:hypothetical protein
MILSFFILRTHNFCTVVGSFFVCLISAIDNARKYMLCSLPSLPVVRVPRTLKKRPQQQQQQQQQCKKGHMIVLYYLEYAFPAHCIYDITTQTLRVTDNHSTHSKKNMCSNNATTVPFPNSRHPHCGSSSLSSSSSSSPLAARISSNHCSILSLDGGRSCSSGACLSTDETVSSM